jgi:hypothetical protein
MFIEYEFNTFTKGGTNRVTGLAQKVIRPTQSAFIELHRKKTDGVLFKIDFEIAYDKVNWSLLQQALRMKGFLPSWCDWVGRFVQGGSVGTCVNTSGKRLIDRCFISGAYFSICSTSIY